jgi:thiol-disulfide isomerase/thioredoxin
MNYNKENLNQQFFDLLLNKEILIGYCDRKAYEIPRYKRWFDDWYEKQEPESYILSKLDKAFLREVQIVLISATWCGACRTETSRFYKILDALDVIPENLTVIYVNKQKRVPGLDLSSYGFSKVPTFIFYKGNEEIGRISERPQDTLEHDLLEIQRRNEGK